MDGCSRWVQSAALSPGHSIAEVASSFLLAEGLVTGTAVNPSFVRELWRNTQRHLKLTLAALTLAIVAGVGIAVLVHRQQRLADTFLYVSGLIQTIPSIALLALLIPLVGVGQVLAIIALFLYSLLPIARSTVTALRAIPPGYRQIAAAMAMTRRQELRHVLMPLAMPHVLAGIRTATIISIGTATAVRRPGAPTRRAAHAQHRQDRRAMTGTMHQRRDGRWTQAGQESPAAAGIASRRLSRAAFFSSAISVNWR
jgi:osmoprotectant transport system permease protein